MRPGSGGKLVYADAAGQVIGEAEPARWFRVVERFHSALLLPRGRLINGVAGLGLVLLAISGLILWWPVPGTWNTAFQIVRRSNWKGLVFDLHRVGGVVALAFVVLSGLTGAYFTWPAAYRTAVAATLPTAARPKAAPVQTTGTRLPVDDLVASAERAVPDARLVRVLVPKGSRQPVTVVLAHGDTRFARRTRTTQVMLHPQTAAVLAIDDYRNRRAGDHLLAALNPLHTGNFDNIAVKILWALGGLALPALFVTGVLMWNNRVLAPRLRRERSRP